ncbi:branched-chain amino acid aminotransferase [Aureimonas fodinaquatilis]|uniref:Probable branched-chain-amino-acid aminotransferase n=1 Tax=Aureimonas fodinaquatilis TaxID=2565783 RepID=A0A5B0E3F8_9HYPH|nr:branched-chain amino acid aminotransferase [Aureimonas fodinaquatilis]KAA0972300.1 branched-chain amino acid aminotransferase [Aureimonas fodinaquatilis]
MAADFSRTMTFLDGEWLEGNPPIIGPRSHGFWLGSTVFDGARWFDGLSPDLDQHAARVNNSARNLGLKPMMSIEDIVRLTHEGVEKFDGKTAIYIRPMYWAEDGGYMGVPADPETTRFLLTLYEAPMLPPSGFTLGISPFRRPTPETAVTSAKAGCLYPNSGRAILQAKERGYDNALMLDMVGNVAETATSNVFMAKEGVVYTPVPNGCFLNGITRQRIIGLMRDAGVDVVEKSLTVEDFLNSDEIFTTGNHSKVVPVIGIEGRSKAVGQFAETARELYFSYARGLKNSTTG